MNFISNIKRSVLQVAALAVVGAVGFAMPQTASANTAAKATILNTVTVNYTDLGGSGAYSSSAYVEVTVDLVSAKPTIEGTLLSGQGPTDQYAQLGSTAVYDYYATNNSNGIDTITLNEVSTTPTNLTGVGATVISAITTGAAADNVIGGTTLSGAQTINTGASFTITIPNDSYSAAPIASGVNGLLVDDWVVIDGYAFTITAIGASHANGNLTTTLTLNPVNPVAGTYTGATGTQVGETGTFTVTVDLTGASITTPGGTTPQVDVTINGSTAGGTTTNDLTSTWVSAPNVVIAKYVRNVSTGTAGTGVASTPVGSVTSTYYPTGVIGAPGETLEYMVVVENTGDAYAEAVTVTDAVPLFTNLYASLELSGYGANDAVAPYAGTEIFAQVYDATGTLISDVTLQNTDTEVTNKLSGDSAGATVSGTTITFNLGNGAAVTPALSATSGGQVTWTGGGDNFSTFYIIYQVKIQ